MGYLAAAAVMLSAVSGLTLSVAASSSFNSASLPEAAHDIASPCTKRQYRLWAMIAAAQRDDHREMLACVVQRV